MSHLLTARQMHAIEALLCQPTVRAAAEACQSSERQLYRWMEQPGFKAELHRLEGLMLDTSVRRLTALTAKSVQALSEVLDFPEQPGAGVRIRAASVVLDVILKWRELLTIEGRVSALEGKVFSEQKFTR